MRIKISRTASVRWCPICCKDQPYKRVWKLRDNYVVWETESKKRIIKRL